MSIITNSFIFTPEQREFAMATYNYTNFKIDPRVMDAASPGYGINLNGAAVGYAAGAAVDLSGGKSIAPYAIVNNPEYPQDMKTFLLTLPCALVEAETIFAPFMGD